MAFDMKNLAPLGNTSKPPSGIGTAATVADLKGAPTAFTYLTGDTKADINTAGYFNAAASILPVGTLIFAVTGALSGGTLASGVYLVNANSGTVVDVTDGLDVTMTDTD